MSSNLTNEEKKRLSNERQNAVRNAWKNEKVMVQHGQGTRDWSVSEQKELIERGSVSGYEGHHMKSVSQFPEYAGDPKNIQFLTDEEHFEGAHQGSYHNPTNGYYDPDTKTMNNFNGNELIEVPVSNLSERYTLEDSSQLESARQDYIADTEYSSSEGDSSDYNLEVAKNDYENDFAEEQSLSDYSLNEESESNGIGR